MEKIFGYTFKNLDFSDFYKVSDLIYYDGPLLSHYVNKEGENFLFHWCDVDDEVNRWIVFRVSLIHIHEYIEGKFSLRDLLTNHAEPIVYVIDLNNDLQIMQCVITEYSNVPDDYKPAHESYYSFNAISSNDIDEYYLGVSESGVLQAIFKNSKKIGYGTMPMDLLSPALFYLNGINNGLGQAYYNQKNKNRPIVGNGKRAPRHPREEVVPQTQFEISGTAPGSFKLFLRPVQSQKAIGQEPTETDNYLTFFTNFIESSFKYEKLLEIVSTLPIEVVSHYEKLLKNIEVNKFDFQLKWTNPISNQKQLILIKQENVSQALENINRLEYENSEEIKLVGKFVELNLITKHYTFIQDDGAEKIESRGYFDEPLKEGVILVQFNKVYEITIYRSELKEAGEKKPKVKDILRSFYEQKKQV